MKKLEDYVVSIPDFPEPGIIFRDVTSILQDADGLAPVSYTHLVNKAMAEFGNFKPKMPSSLNLNTQSRTAAVSYTHLHWRE